MSSLKEIQNKSLEMAEYFVEFCREHDLLCYLCGGGAIGGLRNKGFIPWDDDLDFFMPRKDYEKLITVDVVCKGVPSPKVWRKYMNYQEEKHGGKIIKVGFREKKYGFSSTVMALEFDMGKNIIKVMKQI